MTPVRELVAEARRWADGYEPGHGLTMAQARGLIRQLADALEEREREPQVTGHPICEGWNNSGNKHCQFRAKFPKTAPRFCASHAHFTMRGRSDDE